MEDTEAAAVQFDIDDISDEDSHSPDEHEVCDTTTGVTTCYTSQRPSILIIDEQEATMWKEEDDEKTPVPRNYSYEQLSSSLPTRLMQPGVREGKERVSRNQYFHPFSDTEITPNIRYYGRLCCDQ